MADPPASKLKKVLRLSLEPEALSPSSTGATETIVSTPRGSTEISLENDEISDRENQQSPDEKEQPSAWVPPADLSALKLSRNSIRAAAMPRRLKTEAAASLPLMDSTENYASAILQLPLPPPQRKRSSLGSSSMGSNASPQSASNTTSLALKAQRYSSLKKRKGPNTLLNRLFCNTPLADNTSEDDENVFDDLEANKYTSPESLRSRKARERENESSSSPCIKAGQEILDQASESFTLFDEAKVRRVVQTNLAESMLVSCSAPTASPPAVQTPKKDDDDVTIASRKYVKLVGDAAVGSSGKKSKKPKLITRKFKIASAHDDDGITEPSTKISMLDDLDDIAETSSRTIKVKSKSVTVRKAKSSDDVKTPSASKSKPMKTPGGLVIPTPFTHNSKGIFPTTLEGNFVSRTSRKTSPVRTSDKVPRKSASSSPLPNPRKKVKEPKKSPMGMSLTLSTVSTAETSQSDSVDTKDVEPPAMIRIASSLDDLSTVPELSTSKETMTKSNEENDESTALPKKQSHSSRTANYSSESGKDSLEVAQKELRKELREEHEAQLREVTGSTSSESIAVSDCLTGTKQQQDKLKEFHIKHERKVNELKDQVALTNRLARLRLQEIERLEATMDEMKEHQVDEDEHQRLKDRLEQIQQEQKKEIKRIKREMETAMAEKLKQGHIEPSLVNANNLVQTKPEQSEEERLVLSTEEDEKKLVVSTSRSTEAEVEVLRLKNELADVTEKLAETSFFKDSATAEDELKQVKWELAEVKKRLSAKERQLEITKKGKPPLRDGSPSRKTNSPNRSPSRSPCTRSGEKTTHAGAFEVSPKIFKRSIEAYEQEHERLRQRIASLDRLAALSRQKQEEELASLRKSSEQEIERVRKETESRLHVQIDKERELRETLSDASSREKEELLEEIERLEAEQKSERLEGLVEVKEHEKLLQRIADLEENEKKLCNEREQELQVLRAQGDLEIQKLRVQMQAQKRKLDQAESASGPLKNDELLVKIEKLENQLESERSGAALARLKLANAKEEIEAAALKHKKDLDSLTAQKDAELARLKSDVDELLAIEEAMQIATNERDSTMSELSEAKAAIEKQSATNAAHIEELRKQFASEIATLNEETTAKLESAERDAVSRIAAAEIKSKQLQDDVCKDCDKKIKELVERHDLQIKKMKVNTRASEEKYEKLLKVSNDKLAALESESSESLNSLRKEMQERDEKHKAALKAVENVTDEEQKQLRTKYEELKAKQGAHEAQLRGAEENHNKQFEELLAQLDFVEAEHQQTLLVRDKALVEKEAIVGALGSQLAEAQRKLKETERTLEISTTESQEVNRMRQSLEESLRAQRVENDSLKDARKHFAKEAAIAQEKACEEAREEMIQKAEAQFQQANEHYVKLRKQYDESQAKVRKLETEIKAMKKTIDKLAKEKDSSEIDLKADIAQLNASKAKVEAGAAQKAREYRREMERLLKAAKDFEAKASDSEKTSRDVQKTLATLVAEKEKLQKEYEEMKSVSEELMAIIEDQERHEC